MTNALMRRARRLSSARGRQIWILLFPSGRVVLRDAYVRGTVLIAIACGDDVIYGG